MKIYVVVLNYNGARETVECVQSLKKAKAGKNIVEILVVDNGSTDNSQETLKKIDYVRIIKNEQNLGYSGGNNVGIKIALNEKADYICVLNNDTKVDENFLINFLKCGENVIGSPKIYFYPGSEFHKERYSENDQGKVIWSAGCFIDWNNIIGVHRGVDEVDNGQYGSETEIDFPTGACIFASRKVFEKVGLFDEKYFLYLEDMDFGVRARKKKIKIVYTPKAIIWHKNAASSGGSGSKIQDYYITRNRLLFAFKYAKLRTKIAVLKQVITQSSNQVKNTALFDFITLKFGKLEREI